MGAFTDDPPSAAAKAGLFKVLELGPKLGAAPGPKPQSVAALASEANEDTKAPIWGLWEGPLVKTPAGLYGLARDSDEPSKEGCTRTSYLFYKIEGLGIC